MKSAAIILNSPSPIPDVEEDYLLCADGGYSRVVGAEKTTFVIGDFDSLGKAPIGVPFLSCPTDKDYTDGEKAVRYASQQGFTKVTIYGADGGRMDMQCANLLLLKIAYDLRLEAEIVTLKERIFYTEKDFRYSCPAGKRVSLLPLGSKAIFSSSSGLLYNLKDITLGFSDTIGVSNKTTDESFSFSLKSGGALVFIEK